MRTVKCIPANQSLLKIAMWNIQGLTLEKVTDPCFLDKISKLQIIGFVETWADSSIEPHNLPNFDLISLSSRKKHKRAKRGSGGICIYANSLVSKGITCLDNKNPDIIWIKLNHEFFNISRDMYVAFVYISPENSTGSTPDIDAVYAKLLEYIEKYSKLGDVLIQGDFNAYTNTKNDFVSNDVDFHSSISFDVNYKADNELPRNNLDPKHTNNSGKLLLSMCKEAGLRIVNGRTIGDIFGNFTCIKYNGCSLVDYTIVSQQLLSQIGYFEVLDFSTLSDHCPIVCSMLVNSKIKVAKAPKLDPLPGKFIWSDDAIQKYSRSMNSPETYRRLQNFMSMDFNEADDIVKEFNSILVDASFKSTKFIRNQAKPNNKTKNKRKPWFSDSCTELRNTVKSYEMLVNKFPFNSSYRHAFYSFKAKYRRKCKYEQKLLKQSIYNDLSKNIANDPKKFWKLIDKLKPHMKSSESVPHEEFLHHFKTVTTESTQFNSFQKEIINTLRNMTAGSKASLTHELNKRIDSKEICTAIKSLKNGKSTSNDLISNEMLKYGGPYIIKPIEKLFNFIFDKGVFPSVWNESILVPLHKKGSKADPNNYRGLSVSSNLGKVFNKIINTRLGLFVSENNIISKNQIGFKEKCRTSDHIFTIKSIINCYKKKKVYAAFIDLKKAYDTVWREGLFYVLLEHNVPIKIFNLIHSMYSETKSQIKFNEGLSKSFLSTRGVKQGDVLSPLLFNIFINKVVDKLDMCNSDPIHIGESKVSCLLYADDLVILSSSPDGLQCSLNELHDFCSSWRLEVNITKSKVLIFNSNGKAFVNYFRYNDQIIETVSQYNYLGVVLKNNGKFNSGIASLMDKARKAYFKIKKLVGLNVSSNLLEKLYDSLVVPISLYCCEVWGNDLMSRDNDSNPFELLHSKFIKEILGVHCKTSNVACRAELNRLPLSRNIMTQSIKFLNHLIELNDSLAHKILVDTWDYNPWCMNVKCCLENLGFSALTELLPHNSLKPFNTMISQRINDQVLQHQNSKILMSNKLAFFRSVYKMNSRPHYVDILTYRQDRAALAKLRLSSHNLEIERGRHFGVEHNNRIYKYCDSNNVENETHFLWNCKCYEQERESLYNKLSSIHKFNYKLVNDVNTRSKLLLNSNSYNILKCLSKYIEELSNKRNSLGL